MRETYYKIMADWKSLGNWAENCQDVLQEAVQDTSWWRSIYLSAQALLRIAPQDIRACACPGCMQGRVLTHTISLRAHYCSVSSIRIMTELSRLPPNSQSRNTSPSVINAFWPAEIVAFLARKGDSWEGFWKTEIVGFGEVAKGVKQNPTCNGPKVHHHFPHRPNSTWLSVLPGLTLVTHSPSTL